MSVEIKVLKNYEGSAVKYIDKHYPSIKWAIAGRNQSKLNNLSDLKTVIETILGYFSLLLVSQAPRPFRPPRRRNLIEENLVRTDCLGLSIFGLYSRVFSLIR